MDHAAPLYNADGTVAFFLGGQINCSTTIHNFADVLRVLSQSEDVLEDQEEVQTVRAPSVSKKGGFFRAFRSSSSNRLPPIRGDAGMEQSLVHQIEGRDLKTQMHAFYTAYSKVWTASHPRTLRPLSVHTHPVFLPAAAFPEGCQSYRPTNQPGHVC